MSFIEFKEYNFANKRVILREDFNVPIIKGTVTDITRLEAAIPTIKHLLKNNTKLGIMSHLGRPSTDSFDENFSLKNVCNILEKLLDFPVKLIPNDFTHSLSDQYISLFENTRFLDGETKNDDTLAKTMASVCDIFIMDAFATSHRAHASTNGIAKYADIAIAGPLLAKEINAIKNATLSPKRPVVAIIGGAKISSKLPLLEILANSVDHLIIGGGMANTCLKAQGYSIGKSLYEPTMLQEAQDLLQRHSEKILLPIDVITSKNIHEDNNAKMIDISEIQDDDIIGDIGKNSAKNYTNTIQEAKTIIWNGPVGIFEIETFQQGTEQIAHAIANANSYSIAGGGDTIAAINKFEVTQKISYISTGGGAFLALLQNKELPGITYLARKSK